MKRLLLLLLGLAVFGYGLGFIYPQHVRDISCDAGRLYTHLPGLGELASACSPETAEEFINREMAVIRAKGELLRQAGRIPAADHEGAFTLYPKVGRYEWHAGPRGGYFGAYAFSQLAFEQAMRSWWVHGTIAARSDLLVAANPNAKFDPSVVGYAVNSIYLGHDRSLTGAKVVEFVDEHTVRLDRTAEADGEQWALGVLPPDYVDLCDCTMKTTPSFVSQ
jgi:hypothetical protein